VPVPAAALSSPPKEAEPFYLKLFQEMMTTAVVTQMPEAAELSEKATAKPSVPDAERVVAVAA
jgi:hypothetical protein